MYKAKSKYTHRKTPTLLILTLVIVSIISGGIIPRVNANFSKTLSIDSLFQPLTQYGDNSLPTPNKQQSDRFLHILNQKNITLQTAHKTAIQNIYQQLNQKSCGIYIRDITTILHNHSEFNMNITRDFNLPFHINIASETTTTNESIDNKLRNACTRYLRCNNALTQNQEAQTQNINTCISSLFNTYITNLQHIQNTAALSHINQHDHIYIDGNNENSSFDLIIDMNRIKDLLFESNTTPQMPQMIYYTLPSSYHSAGSIGSNQGSSQSNTIGGSTSNQLGNNNSNTTNQTSTTTLTTPGSDQILDFIQELQGNLDTTPNDPTINPTSTLLIGNNIGNTTLLIQPSICIPGEQVTIINQEEPWEEVIIETGLNSAQQQELEQVTNTINNQLSGFLFNTGSLNTVAGGINNLSNFISTNTTSGLPQAPQSCNNECINSDNSYEKMICEGKCCIRNCGNLADPIQKALCLSECICGEIKVPEDPDILRVRICRIPAQPNRIKAGKKITSIEEAVDEINNIFNTLKNNGLLTKRTKTKEFMDSSFSSIKFHQILAFDIFVAIKPIYDVIQITQRKDTNARDIQKINSINNMSEKAFVGNDKNKYNITTNPVEITTTTYNKTQYQNILNSLKNENNSSMINDQLFIFAQEHYQLREQISQYIIGDMSQISTILATKAKNAK